MNVLGADHTDLSGNSCWIAVATKSLHAFWNEWMQVPNCRAENCSAGTVKDMAAVIKGR